MEEDDEGVRIAIAALGSLKTDGRGGPAASTAKGAGGGRAGPNEITLPPISTIINGDGSIKQQYNMSGNSYYNQQHYQPPFYAASSSSSGVDGSTSTSALTFSPATTPSAVTANSESSSRTSPIGAERPPYSTRFVRAGEEDPYTPGTTISETASTFYDAAQVQPQGDEGFIGRMSQFPIVCGALKVYERGKNSSRVVKYGTDLMESSVKTVSKPVIRRVIGPGLVGQIDDFACRQLDRFGPRSSPRESPRTGETPLLTESQLQLQRQQPSSYFPTPEAYYRRPHGKGRAFPPDTEGTEQDDISVSPTSETPTLDSTVSSAAPPSSAYHLNQQVVRSTAAGRSRWQNLVIEAGVTAGGIGAAVSEESMKSLKYCLHWLHYATAHLDHQVGILQEFILSLSSSHLQRTSEGALARSEDARAANILDGIKREVVETIRKVVDVVSKYAGSALPEQAKRYVRSSILGLPEKWARAMAGQQAEPATITDGEATTGGNSAITAPSEIPSTTHNAAERTLTFAVESLDMLRGVLGIFTDSVERADAWVERLRIVGLQRQQALSAHQRQSRNGGPIASLPNRRGSIASGISAEGSSTGIKRREEDDVEPFQRRKNSRVSQTRDDDAADSLSNGMEVDP